VVSNNQGAHFTSLDSILKQIGSTNFRGLDQRSEGPSERIAVGNPVNDRILVRMPFGVPEPSAPHGRAIFRLNVAHSVRGTLERHRSS
jgi:hypothetical protein